MSEKWTPYGNLNRAQFLRQAAAVGLGVTAVGGLAGCLTGCSEDATVAPEESTQTPGATTTSAALTLEELAEIHAIEQLRTDYWWYMDSKNWEAWRGVFTDDVKMYYGDQEIYSSADAFVEGNSTQLEGTVTCHQAHQHKIEITGPSTATGFWVMEDYHLWADGHRQKGYGFYFDDYQKGEDDKWRIKTLKLGYIHMDKWTADSPGETHFDQVPSPQLPY